MTRGKTASFQWSPIKSFLHEQDWHWVQWRIIHELIQTQCSSKKTAFWIGKQFKIRLWSWRLLFDRCFPDWHILLDVLVRFSQANWCEEERHNGNSSGAQISWLRTSLSIPPARKVVANDATKCLPNFCSSSQKIPLGFQPPDSTDRTKLEGAWEAASWDLAAGWSSAL